MSGDVDAAVTAMLARLAGPNQRITAAAPEPETPLARALVKMHAWLTGLRQNTVRRRSPHPESEGLCARRGGGGISPRDEKADSHPNPRRFPLGPRRDLIRTVTGI